METYKLTLALESDATFGRGDGMAGLVDSEVEHDIYGMPYLRGRTLKGLLAEECANILFALDDQTSRWDNAAQQLFGRPGSAIEDKANMRVGNASLPSDLRAAIVAGAEAGKYTKTDVLESITAIRRQTAMDETGVPDPGSLRAMRVMLRQTVFEASLSFTEPPIQDNLALLAACVMALRRVGTGRNRGRGRVTARLLDAHGQDVTQTHFARFEEALR
jgi:hypothetical protein